ncbi:MAG: SpaH/EbpB family LPXTG-anchored major pilin [Clostridia bacterium]|nr:SpaH/EbpB family LPXTG-anchored major pilin [Clostridia bacterium]
MRNKLLKLVSSIIIICLIMGTVMPTIVKSAEIAVSGINDTGHGVGQTKVYTAEISGFKNIYCVRGGAHLGSGTVLNDDGISLYNTTGEVVKNSSAIQWLFDNMYLTDEKDEAVKREMKNNLIKIVKEYSNYKDANGNNALSTKIGVSANTINDEWIKNMVNALLKDTSTLYTVQQYVIWNNVYNNEKAYNNTMRNSDGTYNSIPGAKVDKKYYVALYATLDELSKVAQVNGYTSPNNPSKKFDVKIQKQNSTKVTVSDDLKTALVGPYKLENNHKYVSKSFNITVDSNKVDDTKIVDKNGKEINLTESQNEFWIKIKYNKGFTKGVKHDININVNLSGHKTYTKLLDTYDHSNQPVVTIRTERYNSTTKTDISLKEELKGDYNLELEKVDSTNNNKKIQGVTFKVSDGAGNEKKYGPTGTDGKVKVVTSKPITEEGIDEYTIKEVDVGNNEYISLRDEIKFYITKSKTDSAYIVSKVSFEKNREITSKNVALEDNTQAVATLSVSGNTVKLTIPNKPYVKPTDFDMALRKSITEVRRNGEKIDIGETREPSIDVFSALEYSKNKTAAYYHTKKPINVKPGDTIIYTIRVYNEGYIDGYAKQITDYLPEGLEFVKDSKINKDNNWTITENQDGTTMVKTDKLKDTLIPAGNGAEGFAKYSSQQSSGEDNKEPEFSKLVQIECKVKDNIKNSKLLVNVAEITNYGYNDEKGNYIEANKEKVDIDSEQDNVFNKKEDIKNIDQYYEKVVKPQYKDDNKFYKGEQDDDDFENVIILSEPEIHKGVKDVNNQDSGYNGNEEHDWVIKSTIPNDIKNYKKYVVTDQIDERLQFSGLEKVTVKIGEKQLVKDTDYKINYDENTRKLKISFIEGEFIAGKSFKEESIIEIRFKTTFAKDSEGNIIAINTAIPNQATLEYDNGSGEQTKKSEKPEVHTGAVAVYKYNKETNVALEGAKFKIATSKENAQKGIFVKDVNGKDIEVISNNKGIAVFTGLEFGGDANSTESNKTTDDITGAEVFKYDFEKAKKKYYIVETEAPTGFNKCEEIIEVEVSKNTTLTEIKDMKSIANTPKTEQKEFDLALRKFITSVNDKEVTSRIPVFKIDENGNYVYNHDKEPVLVANTNIVTYTLRVYNEGEVAGYAKEIKDNIPNGLEFLPDNDLNKEYRWIMFDKYGKETDNADDAKYITTDYLSKEQEKTEGLNLLKPFDKKAYESGSIKEPEYKEVKVSFKVNVPDKSEEIIINKAQISDDSDKDGNEIKDKDSTPNEWIDGEDDQDIEKVKIQYFDLALRKWVTKAIVTENGKETIHETGHKAEDEPEAVVKVDLKKSDINNVKVKFEYKIRVENQGKIAGYAKEISDYIPEGLKFVPEDNPLWEEVEGKVVTKQLQDTLLQPGETAEVTILLTWINSENNMGLKVNIAEISKDYNEYGTPDIDSTPNNKVPGEDDIDDAPVMLTVTTGEENVYVILSVAIFSILATGVILIKKYVL